MNNTIISDGQSLVDVAVQEYGTVEALFDLADANSVAITDLLSPGQVLAVLSSLAKVPALVSYFSGRGQRINTGAPEPPDQPIRYDFSLADFNGTDFHTGHKPPPTPPTPKRDFKKIDFNATDFK